MTSQITGRSGARWPTYSMVAPAYAAKRSALAKSLGLDRRVAQDAVEADAEVDDAPG